MGFILSILFLLHYRHFRLISTRTWSCQNMFQMQKWRGKNMRKMRNQLLIKWWWDQFVWTHQCPRPSTISLTLVFQSWHNHQGLYWRHWVHCLWFSWRICRRKQISHWKMNLLLLTLLKTLYYFGLLCSCLELKICIHLYTDNMYTY